MKILKKEPDQISRDLNYNVWDEKYIGADFDSRLDTAGKKMNNPEDTAIETIQNEKKNSFAWWTEYQWATEQFQVAYYLCNMCPQRKRERRDWKNFWRNNGPNFKNLIKTINPQIQESQ